MRAASAGIVVTGGAGMIGSSCAAALAARGERVGVVDVLGSDGRWGNLLGVPLVDYWHRDGFLAALEAGRVARPKAILHLGACSSTTEKDAAFLMRNNFGYTRALARWCLEHGVRFVYASSAATYGDGGAGFSDDPAGLESLQPLNPYGMSKHAFDLWALRAGALSGDGAIAGLKYFNVYGPGEEHKGEMRSMVLKAWEQILATGRLRLFRSYRPEIGDGEQQRDFLSLSDAVSITIWFVDHPEVSGIFNVGSGVARTWNELAGAVFAALGREAAIEYIDMPESVRGAYQYFTCADLTRMRAAGCGVRIRSLKEGVGDYVKVLEAGRAHG